MPSKQASYLFEVSTLRVVALLVFFMVFPADQLSVYLTISTSLNKVEKIVKGSLDLIPSPSVKIQIMGGKVCLRCKGKTLLGLSKNFLKQKVC